MIIITRAGLRRDIVILPGSYGRIPYAVLVGMRRGRSSGITPTRSRLAKCIIHYRRTIDIRIRPCRSIRTCILPLPNIAGSRCIIPEIDQHCQAGVKRYRSARRCKSSMGSIDKAFLQPQLPPMAAPASHTCNLKQQICHEPGPLGAVMNSGSMSLLVGGH
jgi:hypothetical protein